MPHNKRFTPKELNFIRENFSTMSVCEIAASLEKTPKAVRTKIERMGISLAGLKRVQKYFWTDSDIKIINENYKLSDTDIHNKLLPHISESSIYRKRQQLNLTKIKSNNPYKNSGYYETYNNGERKWVHRQIVEESIGRELLSQEKVHHINGNKLDNRIENLFLCSDRSKHGFVHDSLQSASFELVKLGIIGFDYSLGKYYIK